MLLCSSSISELNLDLLLYPDIGMSSDTYLLGLARLAPVQAVMAGHPCSTGLNEIDYFISSQLMETEDAQVNYSEQLIRFRKMPTSINYIKQTEANEHVIKLDADKIKIGIIHSLFKFTPEFDEALKQISEIDDKIDLIMFETHPNLPEKLKTRWMKKTQKLEYKAFPEAIIKIFKNIYFLKKKSISFFALSKESEP